MTGFLRIAAITVALAASTAAAAECVLPDRPAMPEGRTATQAGMVAAVGAVKAYQGALVEYRQCLDAEIAALGGDTEADKTLLTALYDESVDLEEALATRLNSQIRDYKAAQE